MAVYYTFGNATAAIPLSQLDNNFATPITIGNVAVQLGNTVSTIGNVTLSNATISSLSAPITPAEGGTGLVTITANNVMLGNGTGNVQVVAPGTSGNVLTSNGTTWLSQSVSSSTPTSIANGTSNVSVNSSGGTVSVTTAGTTALTVNTSGAFGVGSSPSYGTSGQVLTSAGSGSAPTWSTPSAGAMTLISTQTASNSATISWTGLTGYNNYLIIFDDVYAATGLPQLQLQTGYGSPVTYNTSGYVIQYMALDTISHIGQATPSQITIAGFYNGIYSAANPGANGCVNIYNTNASHTGFTWFTGCPYNSSWPQETNIGSGTIGNSGGAVTGIQIYMSSGNIVGGKFSLYGISS